MGAINWKRVFLGAGAFLVVYGVIVAISWFAVLRDLSHEIAVQRGFASPENLGFAIWLAVLVYLSGVIATWIYAAIRPRYGAGPKTAFMVGVLWWLGAGALPFSAFAPLIRLPWMHVLVVCVLGFISIVAGVMAAGWLYRELEPAATPTARAAAA